jgi:hypothetical protein
VEPPDLPRRVDLPGEPLAELRVSDVLGPDELDRDLTMARGPAQEYPAHPAFAQPAEQPVATYRTRITGLQRIHKPTPRNPPHPS